MLAISFQSLEDTGIQFTTKTELNMTGPQEYVADSILGGRVDLGDLIGSRATGAVDASTEDYWPRIPHSYGPPPAHLENAVKEGSDNSFP